MRRRRLSQAQKRERTRQELLDAAARVFARDGFYEATLDEVAEDAGLSKGALTYNWKSKEDLFLELLDARLAARAEEVRRLTEQALASGGSSAQLRSAAASLSFDRGWSLLYLEFAVYAARRPRVRRRLRQRVATLREETAAAVALLTKDTLSRSGVSLSLSALANGLSIEVLLGIPEDQARAAFADVVAQLTSAGRTEIR